MAVPGVHDLYDLLDVTRDATDAELKKAFRAFALKYHPDKNPGDADAEERFKQANAAYAVLSDPDRRAAYDRYGLAAFERNGRQPAGFADAMGSVLDGLLGELLYRKTRRTRGRDLRYTLELSFEEAALGVHKTIRFPTRKECPECGGEGARPGGLKKCAACAGRGETRVRQGLFSMARLCGKCGGAGRVVVHPCRRCDGGGLVSIEREFAVTIPPGVENGSVTHVAGEGEPGRRGGTPGDLNVIVRVRAHSVLEKRGHDVWCELAVSFAEVALGTEVSVPTLEGSAKMRIPAGTQSGSVFRMRHKGVAFAGAGPHGERRGDQLVRVVVKTPRHLTLRQERLLRELLREEGVEPGRPSLEDEPTFFDRMRELLE